MTGKKFEEYKTIGRFLQKFSSYQTKHSYKSQLKRFFEFIDKNPDTYIQDVRLMENGDRIKVMDDYEDDITAYYMDLVEKKIPPKTVTTAVAIIRVFFKNCRIQLDEVFWDDLRRRGNGNQTLTIDTPITNKMLEEILNHGELKARALFLTIASSGMRLGEAVQIELRDIDFDSTPTKITIRAEITKNKNRRITFISPEATRFLKEWLKERDDYLRTAVARTHIVAYHGVITKSLDDATVFPFSEDTSREIWTRLIKKAGYAQKDENTGRYKVHVHCLRKFFRTYFPRSESPNGRDVSETLMGHLGYLSGTYLRFTEEQLKEEYLKAVRHLLIFDRPMSDVEQQKTIDGMKQQMNDMQKVITQLMEGQSRELDDALIKKEAKDKVRDEMEKEAGEEKGTPGQTV